MTILFLIAVALLIPHIGGCALINPRLQNLHYDQTVVTIPSSVYYYDYVEQELMSRFREELLFRDLKVITEPYENQEYGISPGSYEVQAGWGHVLRIEITRSYFQTGPRSIDGLMKLTGSRETLDSIFDAVWVKLNTKASDTILTYQNGYRQRAIRKRSMDTIYLPDTVKEAILADIKKFQESLPIYRKYGVPHRRGYLLAGPPGTGKSSLVHAIASHLDYSINIISISKRMGKEGLMDILNDTPENGLVLIEDVDALYMGRDGIDMSLSFSDFINIIDGLSSKEGTIIFMTTNHVENIDPALLRPGRADRHVLLGYVTRDQLLSMFTAFLPEQIDRFDAFYEGLPANMTTAILQKFFFLHLECENILDFKHELINPEGYFV